jgi:hypothetical protein
MSDADLTHEDHAPNHEPQPLTDDEIFDALPGLRSLLPAEER